MTLKTTPSARPIETARLVLREIRADDGAFLSELGRDPAFMEQCTDQLQHAEAVQDYLRWAVAIRASRGFGAYVVEGRAMGSPMGLCTLEWHRVLALEHIGFTILERFRGRGYALEAASALLEAFWSRGAREVAGLARPGNAASRALLAKLGLRFQRIRSLSGQTLAVYHLERPAGRPSAAPWL